MHGLCVCCPARAALTTAFLGPGKPLIAQSDQVVASSSGSGCRVCKGFSLMCVLDFALAAWCHRQMLRQLHQLLSASSQVSSQDLQDFQRLLWAAHLTCLANQSQQAGLLELAARQLTALLHYIGIVPVDRWAATQGWSWEYSTGLCSKVQPRA